MGPFTMFETPQGPAGPLNRKDASDPSKSTQRFWKDLCLDRERTTGD
jgi:hypothetical protein